MAASFSRLVAAAVALAAVAAAGCNQDGGDGGTAGDLAIERRTGYAVVVDSDAGGITIGFSTDRDAPGGTAFDVSDALWRVDDGPWTVPPVTCLSLGQRIELGVSKVQDEMRPGLLFERVVWVSCLSPPEES
jgi:hypothetical protein